MPSTEDNFDPYYTWLGIRPEEQPPDHYRLIGLRQFEDNADVIANASDRQMQFLRSMQVGKRSAQSQALLNEISAAGGCLLDPQRKAKYDQELRAKEVAKAKAAAPKPKPLPKAASLQPIPKPAQTAGLTPLPEADLFSIPLPQNTYVAPVQTAPRPAAQPTSNLPLILGGAAGGVVLLLVVVIVAGQMFSGGKAAAVKVDKDQAGTVKKDTPIEKSAGTASGKPGSDIANPVSVPAEDSPKAKDWQYGMGELDEQSKRVTTFTPLRFWTGNWWQVGQDCPDPDRGWIYVDRMGGSIGNTLKDSAIRRWTAPQAGKLSITGELEHFHQGKMGDGIRGRIVSSRTGVLGEWKLRYAADKTNVENIEIQAGDKIDLIVDCLEDPFCDTFRWPVVLRLSDAQGKELGTWSSAEDFRGPLPGDALATTGNANPVTSPVTTAATNWTPPASSSTRVFRSVLGNYMYSNDRGKTYPFVNLQVPRKNLWSSGVEEKVRGKVPYEEISYAGTAKIAVPADGVYVWDAEKSGRLQIDGKVVAEWDTPKGEIKLTGGVHELIFEIGSHGGNWMRETNLGLRHKETGEEVPFFNTWQDIQKFLATAVNGQSVTEVSGWQPTAENELQISPQLLAASTSKHPRLPRDPKWTPPGDKGQTKFSAFLGTYSHRDRRDKPYPVVNLQVPANNLWSKEIQQKLQGKIPFEEISYRGMARVNITMEGVYVVDTHPKARFDIYSQKVSGHGEVKLPRGEQNISIEIGSHGGPFLAECSLSMHNKATGEEVQFFSYWEEIQKFLATPIEGQSVTEISGWRPTEESDLRGPMYWWDFDLTSIETADDVEKRFNMKLANWKADEPRLVPGKVGNAVRFHRPEHWGGTWSFTDFPHLTVVFWLKALNEEGANQQILSPWVALNYGKRAGVGVLGMVTEPQPPELGKWYHYAVAVNQETKQVHIYRDGVEVASGKLGNYESQSNTKYWALGHHHDLANHSETLRGELDEVRIYDRLLSQDEVKQVIAIDLARASGSPINLPPVESTPAIPPATLVKTPVPNWKPQSNMAFRSMLGNYMYFLDRSKTHPIVSLSVPNKNLWTDEIQQRVRGRGDFNEISYVGKAKIAIPAEGVYVLDTDRVARVLLGGNVIFEMDTPKGDIRLPRGVHDFVIEIHSHGQPYVQYSHLSLRNKATGEEVVFFNTWRDVQRHLHSTVKGQRVMEVTGWQPTLENQVANYEQLVARLPVPDAQTEAAARAKVTSIFGDDLKGAKTGAAKQALAKNLLEVAGSTSDHQERYVLLTEARRLAAEVKDVVVGSRAIDKLAADFEVDLYETKVKLLQGLASGTLTTLQRSELLSEVCDAGYEALAAEKPETVTALAALARSLAGKAVSADTKADAKEFTELAAAHQKRAEALKKAEQTLSASPDDAVANLVVGLQAFLKEGREREGLAMIAKGNDPKLSAAAKLRLDNVGKGATSVEEADAWYEAAGAASAEFKPEILRTALLAYTEVAASGGGLGKAKAEKRRDELAAAVPLSANSGERLRRSDVSEKSPGMVGRVLVNGKDSGILMTHLTPGEMHRDRLKEILNAAKSRQVRLMLAGTLDVPKRGVFRIFQAGGGNPLQTLLVDGKPLSTIGTEAKGGSGDKEMPVDAGQHVILWICDYDGKESPRIDIYLDVGNGREPVKTYCTQAQEFDARKRPFHTEVDVAPYGRYAR